MLKPDRQDSADAVAAIPRDLCLKQFQVRVTDESFVGRPARRAMKRLAGFAGFLVFPAAGLLSLAGWPMACSGPRTRLKRSIGRLSPSRPKKPWPCGGMIVEGLARLLPRRWRVFFLSARGGGTSRLGKHQRFSRQVQFFPPPTFAMRAEAAPFRFFPVTTLKKNATAGPRAARQVDRRCRGVGAGAV